MSEHAPLREVDVWGKQLCSCGERYPCATVILTDLIAELHRPFDSADDCCPDCAGICADEAPCRSARAADRAEARLKGLDDE